MRKILLIGNPNVGKSVVFSRLTGANVVASNYPGTTVDFTKGHMQMGEERYEVIDVPGTYSLEPSSRAEEVAVKMLEEGDIVINVLDSTNLERNLHLTLELLERDVKVVLALNFCDEARREGIEIDAEELQEILGVPVTPIVALTGEGIRDLVLSLERAAVGGRESVDSPTRWGEIGEIVEAVQKIESTEPSLKDRFEEASIRPLTGIPIALTILFLTFQVVRFIGEGIIAYVTEPLFQNFYTPLLLQLSDLIGPGLLHDILVGKLIDGGIAYMESMGLLTTGIFVPFAAVLPYILAFYFALSLLEDSGFLPRLATLVDNIFHRLGMHGQGIVPLFLGLGCNVPGALATRALETRRERFIAATLLSISVPCMAQTAMIFGVLGGHINYIYIVFGTLALIYLTAGFLLNKTIGGESPEIFLEIPPYRRPSLRAVGKKTFMRVRWFIKDAVPWLFFGVFLINVLYALGILSWMGDIAAPVINGMFGLPREAVSAMLVGFMRKDLAVGMLVGLGMSPAQMAIAVTLLAIYFPCTATFAVLIKELGLKDMLKAIGVMLITVSIVGSLMRLILL